MADVQVNTGGPSDRGSTGGLGILFAVILALVIGAAIVWFVVLYRPASSSTAAPTNPGTTINVTVPPISINANPAPVPAAGSNTSPAKPAAAATP
jgi:hypothetical protein